jgi:hypothetical protein
MAKAGPTFIYIGTPKAGSSWLFEAFNENPDIFVHPAKSGKKTSQHFEGPMRYSTLRFSHSAARVS